MKKTTFSNIQSLEDIQKYKLRLKKELKASEKIISTKTDLAGLLLNTNKNIRNIDIDEDCNINIIESLLPLGIKYILKLLKSKPSKKQLKRLAVYSSIGGIVAILAYQYIGKRKS